MVVARENKGRIQKVFEMDANLFKDPNVNQVNSALSLNRTARSSCFVLNEESDVLRINVLTIPAS